MLASTLDAKIRKYTMVYDYMGAAGHGASDKLSILCYYTYDY